MFCGSMDMREISVNIRVYANGKIRKRTGGQGWQPMNGMAVRGLGVKTGAVEMRGT